ncbi:hypothetical protein [Mesorhizobium sp. M0239]|uniref:hypothetical protein n=1 Tax=Mesorhizobium sp. M0239 TaxID=2956924 RepID=UPI0033395E09
MSASKDLAVLIERWFTDRLMPHSRRKVFELADIEAAARQKAHGEKPNLVYPLAVEAVKRIDAHVDIEREINGLSRFCPAQVVFLEISR